MKTNKPNQNLKTPFIPPLHRALLHSGGTRGDVPTNFRMTNPESNPNPETRRRRPIRHSTFGFLSSFVIRHTSFLLLPFGLLAFQLLRGATVTGNLLDINLGPLSTKLTFAPTNDVLVTTGGLSAGPPKTIDTSNGVFSVTLDAGDYTCSLPLIAWRNPFVISVPQSTNTYNITNLLSAPKGYVYTGDSLLADDDSDGGDILLSDP